MSDVYQIEIPPSFIALHADARGRLTVPVQALRERYELCEDLAQHLTEHCRGIHVEIGVDKRTGEIRTAQVTGVRTTDAAGKPVMFRTDPGFNHAPGAGLGDMLKRKQAAAGLKEV